MGETVVVRWRAGWTDKQFIAAIVDAGGLVRGSVTVLEIAHDGACPQPSGCACRCDPDVTATIRPPARGAGG